jgi:glycosyltransferase involved in cell wall biosynthesis
MKVLLVADFYPPAPGGLEAHVRRLGQSLVRAGHRVAVVAGRGAEAGSMAFLDGDVAVHLAGTGLERLPLAYQRAGRAFHPPWPDTVFRRRLRGVVDAFDPDVLHAHGWCAFSAVACAGRRPVVVTLHDYGLRCPKKNLLRGTVECEHGRGLRCLRCPGEEQRAVKRGVLSTAIGRTAPRLAARVRRFIAVSGHVAERHLEAFPTAGRVDVIPNFLDPPAGDFVPPTGSGVLYVGPADRHKGLDVYLRACRLLPPGVASAVVVGVDRPPGAGDGVEFAGRLAGTPLWQRYRDAALVVVPSIWPEPCPTVVLEALAMGRPVVASRVGGIPDLVVDGRTGRLVPPGDPGALADAIASLLADRGALVEMAAAAKDRARQFETGTVTRRIEAVYEEVLAEARHPATGPAGRHR